MPKRLVNEPYVQTPKCPAWLDEVAAAYWEDILPKLVADKLVCPGDIAALAMACTFYSAYMTAVREGNLNNAKKASDAYLRIMIKYGITPEGRSKLEIGKQSKSTADDDDGQLDFLDEFL